MTNGGGGAAVARQLRLARRHACAKLDGGSSVTVHLGSVWKSPWVSFKKVLHHRPLSVMAEMTEHFDERFVLCRCDVAIDEFRRHRLHRMLGRSPGDGRPRLPHPIPRGKTCAIQKKFL